MRKIKHHWLKHKNKLKMKYEDENVWVTCKNDFQQRIQLKGEQNNSIICFFMSLSLFMELNLSHTNTSFVHFHNQQHFINSISEHPHYDSRPIYQLSYIHSVKTLKKNSWLKIRFDIFYLNYKTWYRCDEICIIKR